MQDKFFATRNCDRCGTSLEGKARTMSWFTEDCLCLGCSDKERQLKRKLEMNGISTMKLEGCGFIPNENGEK